jgi:hypothetical protein
VVADGLEVDAVRIEHKAAVVVGVVVAPGRTRLTLGAWSWAGIAGLLATFDADLTVVEPEELKAACRTIADRYRRAGHQDRP